MSKIRYIEAKFSGQALAVIEKANAIISEYAAQGLNLTLRQLYYQFVARDLIPNQQKAYNKLGDLISRGRRAGLIDWEAIEDRTRFLRGRNTFSDLAHALRGLQARYAIDRWKGQEYKVEVWIEKDALIGVIEQACTNLDVDYFSCRGYTSDSEAWRAAARFAASGAAGREGIILHLGDHDPSGVDMSREIQERMDMFLGSDAVKVKRIALTMEQVEEHEPPPNPAKITDPRAGGYIEKYGDQSWELDALEPSRMRELITSEILNYVDAPKMMAREKQEQRERKLIGKVAARWDDVVKFLKKKG